MKPIDLQVNIMKSLDLVQEKNREHFLEHQQINRADHLREESLMRDHQVKENNEKQKVADKDQGQGQRRQSGNKGKKEKKPQELNSHQSFFEEEEYYFDARA